MRKLPEPKVKLLTLRLNPHKTIKAFADIEIQGLIIRDVKVIQQSGQKAYIRLPEASFIGDDGKKYYKHILQVEDPELKKDLNKVVLFAYYRELIKKQPDRKTEKKEKEKEEPPKKPLGGKNDE